MQTPAGPARHEPDEGRPLASYVLRVRGRRASLRYELIDVRSGERHVFLRSDSVMTFLQRNGLRPDEVGGPDGRADR
jgi:hypothetical protein